MLQTQPVTPNGTSAPESPIASVFEKMRRLSRQEEATGFERRQAHIDTVEKLMMDHKEAWLAAIDADFGGRSKHETLLTEFLVVMNSIKEARKHLRDWMRPQRRVPARRNQSRAVAFPEPRVRGFGVRGWKARKEGRGRKLARRRHRVLALVRAHEPGAGDVRRVRARQLRGAAAPERNVFRRFRRFRRRARLFF